MAKTERELAFIRDLAINETWTKRFTDVIDKHIDLKGVDNILYVNAGTGDHCIAIAHWANERGALLPFAKSAMRAIWAEARDMSEYVDLRYVVERAGLPWAEAKAALGNEAAVKWATANAADLAVIGLWGVPSFRCGDFVAWGQDRLPLLADRLRRHRLVNPS